MTAELTQAEALACAADLVEKTAAMLDHLVMDTAEDQALNSQVAASHRKVAMTLRALAGQPDPAPAPADIDIDMTLADRVTRRLTDAWGWLEDEPEAVLLGGNWARAASRLVAGTRTTPSNVLDALIGGPVQPAPDVQPSREDVARAIARACGWNWALINQPGYDDETLALFYRQADAVLALLPGQGAARVRELALREAAGKLVGTPAWFIVLELADREATAGS